MADWLNRRIESLLDNIIFGVLVTGVVVVWSIISKLPAPLTFVIGLAVFALILWIFATIRGKLLGKKTKSEPDRTEQLSQKHEVSISNSYSTGNVTAGKGSSNVGGLIGGIHTGQSVGPEASLPRETIDWLQETLIFNRQNIYAAVNSHISRWNFSGLKVIEDPFFEVHFQLFNMSIFTLDFKGVGGEVKVGGITCRHTKPTANSPQGPISQGQEFYVIVTQSVLPEMAKKILKAGDNKEKLIFDLSQLTLNIESVTKGYEGLKPYIKFDPSLTPDIATWLEIQDSHKIGYWS